MPQFFFFFKLELRKRKNNFHGKVAWGIVTYVSLNQNTKQRNSVSVKTEESDFVKIK